MHFGFELDFGYKYIYVVEQETLIKRIAFSILIIFCVFSLRFFSSVLQLIHFFNSFNCSAFLRIYSKFQIKRIYINLLSLSGVGITFEAHFCTNWVSKNWCFCILALSKRKQNQVSFPSWCSLSQWHWRLSYVFIFSWLWSFIPQWHQVSIDNNFDTILEWNRSKIRNLAIFVGLQIKKKIA